MNAFLRFAPLFVLATSISATALADDTATANAESPASEGAAIVESPASDNARSAREGAAVVESPASGNARSASVEAAAPAAASEAGALAGSASEAGALAESPLAPRSPAPSYEAPTAAKPVSPIRSKTMVVVGSVVSAIGLGGLAAGAATYAVADARECVASPGGLGLDAAFCEVDNGMTQMWATAMMVTGAAHLAVGVPLIAVGARPSKPGVEAPPQPSANLQIGATSATFKMTF